MSYAFRIRFRIERSFRLDSDLTQIRIGADGPRLTTLGDMAFKATEVLALAQRGYATETEARRDGQRWCDAILVTGLRIRKGVDLGRHRQQGGLTEYGIRMLWEKIRRIARNDLDGLDIYEDHDQVFISASADATVRGKLEQTVAALEVASHAPSLSPRVRLALELFGLSHFCGAPRLQFTSLITVVEVLADPQPEGQPICDVVDGLLASLPPSVAGNQSFVGRLRGLKRESIRQACRRLIRQHLGDAEADAFDPLYAGRSDLLHEGGTEGTSFMAQAAQTEDLVARLLSAILDMASGSGTR